MLKFIINLLFPPICVICGADDVHFCNCCKAAVVENLCFTRFENDELDGLISYCRYRDKSIIAKVIHCLKYEFIRELAIDLGEMMSEALYESGMRDCVLCPVPLHKRREKWRGFNQAELLSKNVADGRFPACEINSLLRRTKYKCPQMELGREERLSNVREAFEVMEDVTVDRSRPVILVDDVYTTGATMRECAKALKEAGFRLVYGLVIAQTV